jgi:alginate O-acetyltransferase complex protein AlgI
VYRGEDLDPSVLEFCLYLAFWPTVLSGPICRLPNLLPQLRQDFAPSKDALRNGVNRILIGLFMTAVAQTLAAGIKSGQGVDAAFSSTSTAWSGTDVWCLAIAYGFQLFLDFAGYSHVVIGAARLFGIRLEENFNNPYLSTTPSMFWTRWHMSLSSWIRDYLFLPLATARRELWWRNLALAISMVIFGLWHKGSLLFLIWGVYQGVLLMLHRQWQQFQRWSGFSWAGYVAAPVSWLVTFAAMSLGWIFFRANDLHQARTMWAAVVNLGSYGQLALPRSLYLLTAIVVVGYFCVVGIKWLLEREPQVQLRIPVEFRFAAYAVMFYWAMLHIAEPQAFIYFQF